MDYSHSFVLPDFSWWWNCCIVVLHKKVSRNVFLVALEQDAERRHKNTEHRPFRLYFAHRCLTKSSNKETAGTNKYGEMEIGKAISKKAVGKSVHSQLQKNVCTSSKITQNNPTQNVGALHKSQDNSNELAEEDPESKVPQDSVKQAKKQSSHSRLPLEDNDIIQICEPTPHQQGVDQTPIEQNFDPHTDKQTPAQTPCHRVEEFAAQHSDKTQDQQTLDHSPVQKYLDHTSVHQDLDPTKPHCEHTPPHLRNFKSVPVHKKPYYKPDQQKPDHAINSQTPQLKIPFPDTSSARHHTADPKSPCHTPVQQNPDQTPGEDSHDQTAVPDPDQSPGQDGPDQKPIQENSNLTPAHKLTDQTTNEQTPQNYTENQVLDHALASKNLEETPSQQGSCDTLDEKKPEHKPAQNDCSHSSSAKLQLC